MQLTDSVPLDAKKVGGLLFNGYDVSPGVRVQRLPNSSKKPDLRPCEVFSMPRSLPPFLPNSEKLRRILLIGLLRRSW